MLVLLVAVGFGVSPYAGGSPARHAAAGPKLAPLDARAAQQGRRIIARDDARERAAATPAARRHRARTRTAFSGRDRSAAVRLAHTKFDGLLSAPTWHPLASAGRRVIRYQGTDSALVRAHGKTLLVQSTVPLLAHGAPIDLGLTTTGTGFEPRNSDVPTQLPTHLGDGVLFPRSGLRVRPRTAARAAAAVPVDGKLFYANTDVDSDSILVPHSQGVEEFTQLRSAASPEQQQLDLDLPAGARIVVAPDGRPGYAIVQGGHRIATISDPQAADAAGRPVPVTTKVVGDSLRIDVAHRGGDFEYPILVDPDIESWQYWVLGNTSDFDWWWFDRLPRADWSLPNLTSSYSGAWGNGLYIVIPPYSNAQNLDAATWRFQAQPNAYIAQAEFDGMRLQESTTSPGGGAICTSYGVFTVSANSWDQNPSTVCHNANPWSEFQNIATPRDGNEARFQVWAYGAAVRNDWNVGFLGGAWLSLGDSHPPQPATFSGVPGGWTNNPALSIVASDYGLGVKSVTLNSDAADFTPITNTHGCVGNRHDPCPTINSRWNPSSTSWTVPYSADDLPAGASTLTATVTDLVGNSSSSSQVLKYDPVEPQLQLSGDIYDANDSVTPGTHTLKIDAYDGGGDDPESGVASVDLIVDGNVTHLLNGCTGDSCPQSESRPIALGVGDHDIQVKATDRVNNVASETFTVSVEQPSSLASQTLTLASSNSIRVDGAAPGDKLGSDVTAVGDANGDGTADYAVGAPAADNNGRTDSGSAYVIFGGLTQPVDVGNLGTRGYRIDGAEPGAGAGASVAPAGDVNGDGIADVLVGAPGTPGQTARGRVYVIFGASGSGSTVDLAALGSRGFRVDGPAYEDARPGRLVQSFTSRVGVNGFSEDVAAALPNGPYYAVTDRIDPSGRVTSSTPRSFNIASTSPDDAVYRASVLADRPIAYWRLGDAPGATQASDETGHVAGQYLGGVTIGVPNVVPTAVADTSAQFDGIDDRVRVAASPLLDSRGTVSAEAWIKPDLLPPSGTRTYILSQPGSFDIGLSGGSIVADVWVGGVRRTMSSASGAIVSGQTYHVALRAGTLYLNGNTAASTTYGGAPSATTVDMNIGSYDGTSGFFAGRIDDVAVYASQGDPEYPRSTSYSAHSARGRTPDTDAPSLTITPDTDTVGTPRFSGTASTTTGDSSALSVKIYSGSGGVGQPVQVIPARRRYDTLWSAHTARPLPPGSYSARVEQTDESGLLGKSVATSFGVQAPTGSSGYAGRVIADAPTIDWRLDEASGTTANNAVVGHATGTYYGSPGLGAASLIPTDPGDSAVHFDGVDDRVTTAAGSTSSNPTTELWFRADSLPAAGATATIVSKPGSYSIRLTGNRLEYATVSGSTTTTVAAPAGSIQPEMAYHVVAAFTPGESMRLWVNGHALASAAVGSSVTSNPASGFTVGGSAGGNDYFTGTIDDVSTSYQSGVMTVPTHTWAGFGDSTPPGVTIDSPAEGATLTDATPRISGSTPLASVAEPVVRTSIYEGVADPSGSAAGHGFGDVLGSASGSAAVQARDVNGDGRSDIVVGSSTDAGGRGTTYVIFGKADTNTIDSQTLGSGGFRIGGAVDSGAAGFKATVLGDVNDDGLADVGLTAPAESVNGRTNGGSAYVVYGKADSSDISLGTLGSAGFAVRGASGDQLGASIAAAGDQNADGYSDVLIGGRNAYSVAGAGDPATVDLTADAGVLERINAPNDGTTATSSVASAGDMDGDGTPDTVVGYPLAGGGGTNRGVSYAVYGVSNGTTKTVQLDSLGGQDGTKLVGATSGDLSGVASSASVQASGGELAVGAPGADFNGSSSGSVYLVNEKTVVVDGKPQKCWSGDWTQNWNQLGKKAIRWCRLTPGGKTLDVRPGQLSGGRGSDEIRSGVYLGGSARPKVKVYDSWHNVLAQLRQRKAGVFEVWSPDGATRLGITSPVRRSYIRVQGEACMVSKAYSGTYSVVTLFTALLRRKGTTAMDRDLAVRGFVDENDIPEGFTTRMSKSDYFKTYKASCGGPKLDMLAVATTLPVQPYVIGVDWYTGFSSKDVDEPSGYGGPDYANYLRPWLDVAPGPGPNHTLSANTPGVMLESVTTGVRGGGIVRAIVPKNAAASFFDQFNYLDPNVPCANATTRWRWVDANPHPASTENHIYGWVPRKEHDC